MLEDHTLDVFDLFGVEYEPAAPTITLPEVEGGGLYVIWLSDTHYYGGRAKSFRGRWRRHLRHLRRGGHTNPHMQAVFNQHGRFEPEVITVCPLGEQEGVEQAWLDEHYGKTGCLNLSLSSRNNASFTPASAAKRSATLEARWGHRPKGRKQNLTDEERERRRDTSARRTPEAREKMRRSLTGKTIPAHVRRKMAENSARKGKPITDAIRAGIVRSNKARTGWKHSASAMAKVSQAVKGLVWITKDGSSQRVRPENLDGYLSEGWSRGRGSLRPLPPNAKEIIDFVKGGGSVREANHRFFDDGRDHKYTIKKLVSEQ